MDFLEDTLDKLCGKQVGLLRADSGFFSKEIVQYLERKERPIPYIIAARLHTELQRLFADDAVYRDYRYGCFVTSIDLPAEVVWRVYRMRADAENRIKELKYDFGADNFNVKNFSATEAAMNFVMLAYNLMSLFRQVVLGGKVQPTLKTMRFKVFAVSGYLTQEDNVRILKLSMAMLRREWFSGLWDKSKSFDLPAHFSSHL